MHHPTDRILNTTAFVTPVVKDWLERGSTSSPTGIGSGGGWFEVLWNLECPVGLSQKRNMCAFQWSGTRCSSVVRALAHGAMRHRIDPSWWTHWAISRSGHCPTTSITKAVVCVSLSVG